MKKGQVAATNEPTQPSQWNELTTGYLIRPKTRREIMYQYFAYDPDVGFETFKTKQEAIDFANSVIDEYRENSGDGWDEIVGQVCWGEIKQQAMMTDEQPAPPESGFDYTCDYALGDLTRMAE